MNILALDTAGGVLSAALSTGGETWYAEADAGMRHSELLLGMADQLCGSAGIGPEDLGGVLCMGGPGSFTGLRIGFAVAKGLALSRGIPWASVPTLDCIAYPHSIWPGLVVPVIDARKRSFFTALYRGGLLITDYLDAESEVIAGTLQKALAGEMVPILLTGPDGEMLRERLEPCLSPALFSGICLDPAGNRGRARELLAIAASTGILENKPGELYEGPLYLRKSDAEIARIG